MGLLDIFSKQSRVTRNVKKLNNKWVHMDERRSAIENLRTLGTDEAIEGLLQRFKFVIDNTTVDEDEKQNVCDALAEFGERSLPLGHDLRRAIAGGIVPQCHGLLLLVLGHNHALASTMEPDSGRIVARFLTRSGQSASGRTSSSASRNPPPNNSAFNAGSSGVKRSSTACD